MPRGPVWALLALGVAAGAPARADDGADGVAGQKVAHVDKTPAPIEGASETIIIVSPPPEEIGTGDTITREELDLRSRRTPGQLLEAVPGLIVGQHAGGGKADQIFLRGFDADHGTDVAVFVDGVPVNLPSHAHGQGYADLHFVIPEAIDHIHLVRGPYAVESGDFATGGAVRLQTARRLGSFVTAGGGSFATWRVVGATGGSHGAVDGWIAGELYGTDGPFAHAQRLARHNVMGKATFDLGMASDLWIGATSYASGWNASGQIPARAVGVGGFTRWDAIDPTEGGVSSRHGVQIGFLTHPNEGRDDLELRAWAYRYQLDLFSNFTFFLEDPLAGDGIEQVDRRSVVGLTAEHRIRRAWRGLDLGARLGLDARSDDADVALYSQRARERRGVRNAAHVSQSALGTWAEMSLGAERRWRLALGVRADLLAWQVDDAQGEATPGVAKRAIANPKLCGDVRLGVVGSTAIDLLGAAGGGFHSNDARNVIATGNADEILPRAWSGDLALRWRRLDGTWELTLGAWGSYLERELVWVGDAGGTEARGASRRVGVEATGRARLLPWLGAQVEASYTRADFTDGSGAVPLAPRLLVSAGLVARHPRGVTASLRLRHVGDRPAEESGAATAEGYTVLDAIVSYRRGRWELELDVDNVTNAEWREAQFFFESRLRDEPMPVEDLHFTPGVPLSARASLTYRF